MEVEEKTEGADPPRPPAPLVVEVVDAPRRRLLVEEDDGEDSGGAPASDETFGPEWEEEAAWTATHITDELYEQVLRHKLALLPSGKRCCTKAHSRTMCSRGY